MHFCGDFVITSINREMGLWMVVLYRGTFRAVNAMLDHAVGGAGISQDRTTLCFVTFLEKIRGDSDWNA